MTPGAAERLTQDWLRDLIAQFVRAAGLLQPGQPVPGGRLSLSEWWALSELAEAGPMTQRHLSERLDLEKSTVSRLVAGLEGRGLVSRERDADNRRFTQVTITAGGRSLVDEVAGSMLERHAHIFSAMTPAERDALAVGMTALVRAMDEAPPVFGEGGPSGGAAAG